MALQIWLPLNGNIEQKGLANVTSSTIGTVAYQAGKIGNAFRAGGTSQVTNGVSINSNLVDLFNANKTATVAVWVKPLGTHYHYNGTIISSGNWNASCWAFGVSQDNTQVDMFCGHYNRYVNCTVPANEWTHLVSVFNNRACTLYKNGVQVATYTSDRDFSSDASNTCIGRETYANGYFGFNGLINDLRVYDNCLTIKEIQELYKCLVLHYKLDDIYIEPTTNLITTTDCLTSTCYNGATSKYGYGTSTDMYKTTGIFNGRFCTKLYMGTDGLAARPYVYISPLSVSNGTNAPAYRTLSFDYFTTVTNNVCMYKLGSGSGTTSWKITVNGITNTYTTGGGGGTADSVPVVVGEWNHIEVTFHGTTSANAEFGYLINGNYNHTSSTSNYWLFSNMQIENKDHATGYAGVNGTRSDTQVRDSSGFGYNGYTQSGRMIYTSSDSPRYNASTKFPFYVSETGNYITMDNADFFPPLTACTVTWWGKYNATKSLLLTGQSTSYFLAAGNPSFYNQNANVTKWYTDGVASGTPSYVANQWHFYAFTGRMNTWTKLMLNNYGGENTWSINGQISDFRIYNSTLSDADILELYHTSASIDRNGNYFTRELVE